MYIYRFNLNHPQCLQNNKQELLSSSRAVCWVGTSHLRRNMPPDEVELGGTAIEYIVAEPREQMPSSEDRAVGLSPKEVAGRRSRSVRLGPEHRS